MALVYTLYNCDSFDNPDSGTVVPWLIQVDDNVLNIYPDVVKTYTAGSRVPAAAPSTWPNLASAQSANPTAIVTAGLPRSLQVNISGFGTANLPVLTNRGVISSTHINGQDWSATLDDQGFGSATPFPTGAIAIGDLEVFITGYRGEQRSSN